MFVICVGLALFTVQMIQHRLFLDVCRQQQLYDDRRWLHSEIDLLQIRWIWLTLVQRLVDGKH